MKTILSNKGYKLPKKSLTNDDIELIKKDLIINPFTYDLLDKKEDKTYHIYSESEKFYYVPRFWGIKNFGMPKADKLSEGIDIDVNFKGELRDYQKDIVDLYMKEAYSIGGSVIGLATGGGKTVLALYIISLIKKKTIILIHKSFLLDQWYQRITEFLPGLKVTKIQSTTYDDTGDIILVMIQTLINREIPDSLINEVGLLISDECHHISAECFSRSLVKINPKYLLGLSATVKRGDSLQRIFHYYLGDCCYKSKVDKSTNVEVRLIQYDSDDIKYCKEEKIFNGKICRPRIINNIANHIPRTEMILEIIYKCYTEGRHILVLSDRREHCIYMVDRINKEYGKDISGVYIGGMSISQYDITNTKQIIIGTYSAISEGYDRKALTTLILSTPISNVEQSVGRILREKNAHNPLIYDIIDEKIECIKKQASKRQTLYKKRNYACYYGSSEEKIIWKTNSKSNKKNMWEEECLL